VPPAMAPWQPAWTADIRIDAVTSEKLIAHYVAALDVRRKAHEMGAVFGGRLPHTASFIGGGFTGVPTAARIEQFRAYAAEIHAFVRDVYLPDVDAIAAAYGDYFEVGVGPGNLLAFGGFEEDAHAVNTLFRRGRLVAGSRTVQPVDVRAIAEDVASSWYAGRNGMNPASGTTIPLYPKPNAYSWSKSPRYGGTVYEVGPLARMTVNGEYSRGVSVLDRHLARAAEALKIANAIEGWLSQLEPSVPVAAALPALLYVVRDLAARDRDGAAGQNHLATRICHLQVTQAPGSGGSSARIPMWRPGPPREPTPRNSQQKPPFRG